MVTVKPLQLVDRDSVCCYCSKDSKFCLQLLDGNILNYMSLKDSSIPTNLSLALLCYEISVFNATSVDRAKRLPPGSVVC